MYVCMYVCMYECMYYVKLSTSTGVLFPEKAERLFFAAVGPELGSPLFPVF